MIVWGSKWFRLNRNGIAILALAFLFSSTNNSIGQTVSDSNTDSGFISDSMLPAIMEPAQQVDISAPIDGVLMTLAVEEGQSVTGGSVLASLDNREAKAAVKLARIQYDNLTEIDRARKLLEQAQIQCNRMSAVENAISKLEMDQCRLELARAKSDLEIAIARRKQARGQWELAIARLKTHDLIAPFDGRVMKITGRVGQSLNRTDALLTIANLDRLRADLNVPVRLFKQIQPGDHCLLKAGAPVNQVLKGRIVSVEPRIDSGTQTFRCVIEFNNRESRFPAGFAVSLYKLKEKTSFVNSSFNKSDK